MAPTRLHGKVLTVPALDDIISSNRKQTRAAKRSTQKSSTARTKKSAKAAAVGASAAAAISQANRQQPPVVIPGRTPSGPGSKIIVSNLPVDVTEAQVKELFSTTIGPLRRVMMSYRANGQSTGVVTVIFQRAEDANRAYTQYNNRLIDSKRPLKIEVVVDPAQAAAEAAKAAGALPGTGKAGAARKRAAAAASARGRGGRGRRGGRGGRASRPAKSAEDLDAEMEGSCARRSCGSVLTHRRLHPAGQRRGRRAAHAGRHAVWCLAGSSVGRASIGQVGCVQLDGWLPRGDGGVLHTGTRRCANTWRLDPVCGGDDAAARRAPGIGAEATERAWRRASDARARTEAWRPGAGAGSLLAAGCRLAGVASDRCSVCAVRRCGRRRGRTAHAGRGGRCGERDYVCAGVVATAGARRAGPRRGRRGVGRARRRSRPRRGARETSELGRRGGGKPAAYASHVRACL